MNTWQNHTNGAQHRATRIYRSGLGWNWQVTKQGSAQLLASGTSDTRKAAKEAAEYALLHYAPSADPKPLRIAFIGSAATGKTTLTRWVKKHYGLPMINEIARQVLGELETDFPTLHADLDETTNYQREVFKRQIRVSLQHTGGYVSDRAHDNLAYASDCAEGYSDLVQDPDFSKYLDHLSDVLIFFVRPHKSLLKDDGVRAPIKWRDVLRIDGMIKLLLRSLRVPKTGGPLHYFEINSPVLLDRVELVRNVVALRSGV